MPFTAEISRKNPTAFLFVIDQSGSMNERMSVGKSKAEFLADVLNKTLSNLVIRSTKADGIREYFDVGVLAYCGSGITPGFGGSLAGSILHKLSAIGANPLRVENRARKVDDGAGGLVEQSIKFPIWFEPRSSGGTPMCEALRRTAEILVQWCDSHPSSYPPTVIHVTDGESTDGDPEQIGVQLQGIATDDGPVLLFNLHISTLEGRELMFPAAESELPDANSHRLFRMSSLLPPPLQSAAQAKGYTVTGESRFFGYNADAQGIVDFFDIGTRASELR